MQCVLARMPCTLERGCSAVSGTRARPHADMVRLCWAQRWRRGRRAFGLGTTTGSRKASGPGRAFSTREKEEER
eukprot:206891-Rhodomonas_salina.1